MLFNSIEFLIFFPITILLYFCVPRKIKNPCLLLASYFFYGCWNAKYTVLLLATTIVTYLFSLFIQKINDSNKNHSSLALICLIFILAFNFGILFFFKYYDWFFSFIEKILHKVHVDFAFRKVNVILPVGISFFTFQAVGYSIDVFRREINAEKNFLKYALFVSFFPQLVAGPIERSKNLLSQLDNNYSFDYERARKGFLIMFWGFFLKLVIADRAAILVNEIYGNYNNYRGFEIIIATLCFSLQIYCDFMGYSTIARGAALIIGIKLTDNFKQPYFSVSIKEFWRRWHISLSSWLKDYIYIPLGGSRCSKQRKYFNLLVTFLISGAWHGASWNFIAWGLLHGLFQIVEDFFTPVNKKIIEKLKIKTECFSYKLFLQIKTFVIVSFAWIFFRASSFKSALKIIKKLIRLTNPGLFINERLYKFGLSITNFNILIIAVIILFIVSYMREKKINIIEWLDSQNLVFRFSVFWLLMGLIIFSLSISGKEFVYFQF